MEWKRGEQAKLAELAGFSKQHVSDILNRKIRASYAAAVALEKASRKLGKFIPRYDFIECMETRNPLFHGAPKDGETLS